MKLPLLNNAEIKRLERNLNYEFQNKALLHNALTHRSVSHKNNERLEFLGDSILNFVIGSELFYLFNNAKEGELTRMRANLVREPTLAEIAQELKLGDYLFLGVGELKSGGHQRASILADALEAIIGAIFLDADLAMVRSCIIRWYQDRLSPNLSIKVEKDAKTKLQEYLQGLKIPIPTYQIVKMTGEPHNQEFTVECQVSLLKEPIIGSSNSRRKAEQVAADKALRILLNDKPNTTR
ncbi:MAG: ribonuclease [Francisellaceae bacterium]|nr:ribonuclease [Francisellaceae bacterium]